MKTAAWVVIGWFWVSLWTALGARLSWGYLVPDAAIVVVVFLALRREPIPAAFAAVALGYLVGRQAGAPTGLHEAAMLMTAVGVYAVSGRLAGGGALFFSMVAGGAATGYPLLIFLMLHVVRGGASFASWHTALLVPGAAFTAVVALAAFLPMQMLDSKLAPKRRGGLQWD